MIYMGFFSRDAIRKKTQKKKNMKMTSEVEK